MLQKGWLLETERIWIDTQCKHVTLFASYCNIQEFGVMVLDRHTTPLSPLSHLILMEWCVYKHQEWYPLNSERIMHFSQCCEALKLWVMFASFQQYATPSEKHFWVCGSYKLEFRTCLNSQSAWRLALDSVEQSQSSCVIIGLGQEMYAEKPITYILLQVSISYIGIRAFIDCSQCHRYI